MDMVNRLSGALSPYLRQHADNPVDWWPWCDEAFAEARRRDVPVLLSVGYASCHWCHVMAHESFDDIRTAHLLNERFVSIKVDREERPDIDDVYMAATQVLTGRGGWPMTAFLDHEGSAFYAGTYFPPVPHGGMPSFSDVLRTIDEVWRSDRHRIERAARQVEAALDAGEHLVGPTSGTRGSPSSAPSLTEVTAAIGALVTDFDQSRGGFGGAAKFPPAMVLEFLLRADALLRDFGQPDDRPLRMVEVTAHAMARGGMYDQLAGGFARYSVDADWVVPHFEKMLYDNALLLRAYLHLWRATGDPVAHRVVHETVQFLMRDLRTPEGGFASSLDADSEGREGAAYVWTSRQLTQVLGPDDAAWVARLCDVTAGGTFERGASVLQLRTDPDDPLRWAGCREALLEARGRREQPARDAKVVTAWNGLVLAALAEAGALMDEPEWVAAARWVAEWLVDEHWDAEAHVVARTSLAGVVNPDATGVLEDYADLADGLLVLFQVTGEARWFTVAQDLVEVILARFADGRGGFFDTAVDAPALVRRPRDPSDGVTPSGASASAQVLLTLGSLTGDSRYRQAAEEALVVLRQPARSAPRFAGWTLAAVAARLAGPVQVAIVVPGSEAADDGTAGCTEVARQMRQVALMSPSPGLVVATGHEGQVVVPLLADRPALDGAVTAYPCRRFVCELPVTGPDELREALRTIPRGA